MIRKFKFVCAGCVLLVIIFLGGCGSNASLKKSAERAVEIFQTLDPYNLDYEISVEQLTKERYRSETAYRNYRNTIYVATDNGIRSYLDGAYGILYTDDGSTKTQTNYFYWYQLEISFDIVSVEAFDTFEEALKTKDWDRASSEEETSDNGTVSVVTLEWDTESIKSDVESESSAEEMAGGTTRTESLVEMVLEQEISYDENGDFIFKEVEHVDPLEGAQLSSISYVISEDLSYGGAFQASFLGADGTVTTVLWNDIASVAQSYREELWHNGGNAESLEEMEEEVIEDMSEMGISYVTKREGKR